MEMITSRSNPLCTHFRKLASSRAYREEAGEFLCDSPKLLGEAVRWGAPVKALLYTGGADLPPLSGGAVRVVQVSGSVMKAVSPMETPQGVVFSCRLPRPGPPEIPEGRQRVLLLDGVQDPGNVGTMLRTADAFGWRVFLLPGCADLYNPKTVRASMGAAFRLRVQEFESFGEYLADFGRGRDIFPFMLDGARVLTPDTCPVTPLYTLVFGNEATGLPPEYQSCGQSLFIAQSAEVDSLNLAVAVSVGTYLFTQQNGGAV